MFKKVVEVTVKYEDGSEKTYAGPGGMEKVNTAIKQDKGQPVPTSFVQIHMEVPRDA